MDPIETIILGLHLQPYLLPESYIYLSMTNAASRNALLQDTRKIVIDLINMHRIIQNPRPDFCLSAFFKDELGQYPKSIHRYGPAVRNTLIQRRISTIEGLYNKTLLAATFRLWSITMPSSVTRREISLRALIGSPRGTAQFLHHPFPYRSQPDDSWSSDS